MAAYKGSKPSVMCLADHHISTGVHAASATSISAHSASANWSGYVGQRAATVEANKPFSDVQGQWVQTGWRVCGCNGAETDESTWVGMGGYAPTDRALIQDGTDMYFQDEPRSWFEYLHACPADATASCGPPEIAAEFVPVGQTVFAETYVIGTTANFFVVAIT